VQRLLVIALTLVCLGALLSFAFTYQVRFTEAAVLTTFGRASEEDIKRDPGLRFKWPYPVQSVTKYDTRLRFLEQRLETQQTRDDRQIVVQAYALWRVSDPLKFFRSFSNAGEKADDHYTGAENVIRATLRDAVGATSQFRLDELFTSDAAGTRLPDLEKRILDTMRGGAAGREGAAGAAGGAGGAAQADKTLADLGIEVADVGISSVILPKDTSQAVFNRMIANRDRLAKELESRGDSDAQAIRSAAEADAARIMAFAARRAQEIRARGDLEAAPFLKQMQANPDLAVFLKNMEFVRDAVSKRTTLVLAGSLPGLGALSPDFLSGMKPGQIPAFDGESLLDPQRLQQKMSTPATPPEGGAR
jgi:membrane protease subunit HflC